MSKSDSSIIKPQLSTIQTPKMAFVIDWLDTMGGAETMLLVLHEMYPEAPIYTSVYDKKRMTKFSNCDVRTSYMQWLLPAFIRYKHVLWPVLRAHAFRQLDMSEFDLIISVSTAEAKAVKKRPDSVHICYCNTPTRYFWSHYEEFKKKFNFGPLTFAIRPFIPLFVRWMRRWDLEAASRVDYFLANSTTVGKRIEKYYERESKVVFPPVNTNRFSNLKSQISNMPPSGFIVWGRHVPYKRFDLAVEACTRLNLPLTVIGTGPETKKLKAMAGPTITFAGRASDEELERIAHQSEAFLFPGEEDFGISPVEAMAAGLPVIAYKSGGALDYVIEGKTGVFFEEQTVESLCDALSLFNKSNYSQNDLVTMSQKFSTDQFVKKLQSYVKKATKD
jgi:glycosyltransferase involved in cell wall biosynthesis